MGHLARRRELRRFERFALLALAMAIGCSGGSKPRNVLLITIDTLRADALGAYGSKTGASPHFDRLAQRGVLFEQASSPCPNTLPSHSTILTGLYPYRHGVRDNGVYKLADPIVTLAERMRDAGYATGAEVAAIVLNRPTGIAQGFTHFVDIESPGIVRNQITVDQDGGLHDPSAVPAAERAHLKTVYLTSRGAGDITRAGIAFLREHRDGPFFLWLHYYDPHWPYAAPAPFEARFASDRYAGEVAYSDESVANVIDELGRLGLDDRTLVVVTGDHGEGLGDHGESHHNYYLYQSTIHVPLVLVGPQVAPGQRVATPVSLADIAPTILAWAGLAPNTASDGVSLVPALTGGELPSRPIYGDSVSLGSVVDASPVRFLRDGRWKLIHKPIPELYDLIADPAELANQADREGARMDRMREQMRVLIAIRPEAEAPRGELDAKTQQQLASLGYVVGDPSRDTADTMDVYGPDPTTIAVKLEPFVNALGATQFVDIQETADVVEHLSREFPASSRLLEMMLDVQLGAGRTEQALATLRRGIEIDPDHKRYWTSLGELLMRLGRHAEARKALTETLHRWPCELTTRTNLANVHAQLGAREDQIEVLEQGVEQCNAPPELMNDLAYQLATVRVAKLRDGPRALELAEKMIGSLGDNPLALDTLAVAQAEVGRRDDARGTLARALDLAKRQHLPDEGLRVLQDHATKIAAGESIRE